MAKNDVRNSIKLTTVDDLFSTEESRADSQREKVLEIPLLEITDFPNHPFKVKADEAMLEMADSIKQYGVLVPGLVRPKADGGYEMVAGHRRKKASELAGRETMSCIVRDLDDDAATIIMVDSNLQRESILPSEKAFAYKSLQTIQMKAQGKFSYMYTLLNLHRPFLILWTKNKLPLILRWEFPTYPKTNNKTCLVPCSRKAVPLLWHRYSG